MNHAENKPEIMLIENEGSAKLLQFDESSIEGAYIALLSSNGLLKVLKEIYAYYLKVPGNTLKKHSELTCLVSNAVLKMNTKNY
jgi:hypothetical protein